MQADNMMADPIDAEGTRLPRSLYAETAREPVAAPPLRGDKRVGVVVVGGGFTGLSTALHLAQHGADVAVLEAREPGWGASGRNGGQVNPGLKHEPEAIERRFGPDVGRRMVSLSGGAPDRVFALIREFQIRCEANQGGTIRAAFSKGSAKFLRQATAAWKERGAPVELLEGDAIARATGTDRYLCGALDRRGGSLNPLGYARGLADAAIRAGAVIHGSTSATAVERRKDAWAVVTPGGTVTADWLVLATNGYSDGLWPSLRQTIVPVYSGIVATEPLTEDVAKRILPMGTVLYEHEDITVYYRLDVSKRLLMGGRSRLRTLESPNDFLDLIAYTKRLWPFIGNPRWTHGWNGQLALTLDHYPHLHEPAQNVIACLGYNGRGVAMATAMGAEIARRIAGTPAAELDMPVRSALEPIRLHRFWPIGVTARLAYGRLMRAFGV
jgi:glycine/D-amino acid oxidase-like deaminating enzyme